MTTRILTGDCRAVLKTLPSDSVHCCVTSPPYWGLRSYLPDGHPNKHLEIGSEPTLQEWVDTMVEVFTEVRRVLRPDGTLWLNLGDAYAGSGRGGNVGNDSSGLNGKQSDHSRIAQRPMTMSARRDREQVPRSDQKPSGLKPKDMMGQPWRVAFALQASGWWLRQEIIWHKPNPMPESARDRCTKAHEHIFLLAKSGNPTSWQHRVSREWRYSITKAEREEIMAEPSEKDPDRVVKVWTGHDYFYDFDAMQEPSSGTAHARSAKTPDGWDTSKGEGGHGSVHKTGREKGKVSPKAAVGASTGYAEGKSARMDEVAPGDLVDTRNPRSVWTIPTHAFKGSHFATFPPELAKRCITAGCPPGGTVLDPFYGSGTVGLMADGMQRDAILIDLDERNTPMATERIVGDSPLFADIQP